MNSSNDQNKTASTNTLQRSLGLGDAIAIGLGAVIGAGIFVVSGVAAGIAGPAMLISLLIAGLAAAFNGLSSAQLAAGFPAAGGTYEYAYELLNPVAGFSAGWMFLASKLAAGGVVALGFASYLRGFFPALDQRWSATVIVVLLVLANIAGIRKAGMLNWVIVSITVLSLLYFISAGSEVFDAENLVPFAPFGFLGIAEAAAVLFFAFTGYARIATLGEEVKEPRKNIPRAIISTLIISFVLYSLIAVVALGAIGAPVMAEGGSPLFTAAQVMNWPGIVTVIGIAGITSMMGVLLSQILGTSRMFFAMARRKDLPQELARVSAGSRVPVHGILLSGAIILLTVWLGELTFITQTASFTILLYYGIANLSALRLKAEERFLPRWISWAGLILCILMAFSLPWQTILAGIIVLFAGHLLRLLFRILNKNSSRSD
ncbi:MAG: amino acid permease [Eubacteriales bacterium]|nr:amino acid permease [Eubacteriales bacterium]